MFVLSGSVSLFWGIVLFREVREAVRVWRAARPRALAEATVPEPEPEHHPPTEFEKHLFAVGVERMRDEGWTVHVMGDRLSYWAVLEPWRLKERQPELPFPKREVAVEHGAGE